MCCLGSNAIFIYHCHKLISHSLLCYLSLTWMFNKLASELLQSLQRAPLERQAKKGHFMQQKCDKICSPLPCMIMLKCKRYTVSVFEQSIGLSLQMAALQKQTKILQMLFKGNKICYTFRLCPYNVKNAIPHSKMFLYFLQEREKERGARCRFKFRIDQFFLLFFMMFKGNKFCFHFQWCPYYAKNTLSH